MERREDINGLRALGVALVVFFHLQLPGSRGSFIGVDVFFVISGYLITKTISSDLSTGSFNYFRFLGTRAARVFPALAAMIATLLFLGAIFLPPFDLKTLAEQAVWAALSWSNHFFLDHAGYNTHTDELWLLHTWSLGVEWQFYTVYPLLLLAASLVRKDPRLWVGMLAMAALFSIGYQFVQLDRAPQRAFFLLASRAWELLAGGIVFAIGGFFPRASPRLRLHASYAGTSLILLSALAFAYLRISPVDAAYRLLFPVLGTALVLWAAADNNVLLNQPLAQRLGEISYSVYLWHWPLIIGLRLVDAFVEYPWIAEAFVVLASLGLGFASFRYVERPMRIRRSAWNLRAAMLPVAAAGLVGVAATGVFVSDGLALRQRGERALVHDYFASKTPFYFPKHCDNFTVPASDLKLCSLERGGKGRILVIGDSHAEHFYPWFERHSETSVDFFTVPECPPVPRFERMQSGFHCKDYATVAWQKAASPTYDTLIVSARWATINGLLPYCHSERDGQCTVVEGSARRERVLTELRSAIETVLDAGKTVVLVKPSPESRFTVPERLARESFWYGRTRLAIDFRAFVEQSAWLEPLFRHLDGRPGFHLLTFTDKLCDRATCKVFDSVLNRPIYMDDSHFDPTWIIRNGERFAPFTQGTGKKYQTLDHRSPAQ